MDHVRRVARARDITGRARDITAHARDITARACDALGALPTGDIIGGACDIACDMLTTWGGHLGWNLHLSGHL